MRRFRQKTFFQITIWTAAALVGVAAVLFARLIELAQKQYFTIFHGHPYLVLLGTPLLFVAATLIVEKFGPQARGSGIPQVLEAIDHAHTSEIVAPPGAAPLFLQEPQW